MNNDRNTVGVALTKCYICGEVNAIILNTRLTPYHAKKVEDMNGKVISPEPCNKCKEYMKQGVILISVRDGESGNNPYRTGGWVVVKDEAIKRIIDAPMNKEILKKRIAFLEDSTWKALGLPELPKEQ